MSTQEQAGALLDLLMRQGATLVIRDLYLCRGNEYWHVGIKNDLGGVTEIYCGDLAGAIAEIRQANEIEGSNETEDFS